MKNISPSKQLIIELLKEKAVHKQDVYANTLYNFNTFKQKAEKLSHLLTQQITRGDKRVEITYSEKSGFEFHLKVAGDLIIFHMHTNIFDFDKSHPIWKNSYVKNNNLNAYCGLINVYNFLSDSFKYNRTNDVGYLIGRIFINKENHFFVEGKRQLSFLYNDFNNAVLTENSVDSIIDSIVLYALSFDLLTPPYDSMKEVSMQEILEVSQSNISTGKRLGFKFQADADDLL
ncbi:MAG: hypothetical protein HUU48_07800 [Flavobacteriales bacterium]|nr:hypothetical protein [Flavobacteriales bacterium]